MDSTDVVQTAPPPTKPAADTPAISLQGVTLAYGRLVVLSRASLSMPPGSLAGLIGPPGAGKTSLLRCLSGQSEPRSGEVRVLGERPRAARERVAYVPPPEVVDWDFPVSVGELVMTGRYGRLGLLGRPGPRDRAIVRASLERMDLVRAADRRIGTLGAAERARALLARALAREPHLVLLDEPWSAPGIRDDTALARVEDEVRSAGGTIVVATGRLDQARRFDRIALLNGRVVADGRPEVVLTAENLRATFGDRPVLRSVAAESFAEDR